MTLSLDEFLRRFLLHVLPKFRAHPELRFLANRSRATLLPLCFHLLGSAPQTEQTYQAAKPQLIFGYAQMRWTDDGHRKTHRCRNPTSFSSRPRHRGRMKRLSTTRNLCVCQRGSVLCAWPLRKPRPSTLSSIVLVRVLRFRHLFNSRYRLSCSAAQLRHISTTNLPTMNLHKARVRRNHGRLPSNRLFSRGLG